MKDKYSFDKCACCSEYDVGRFREEWVFLCESCMLEIEKQDGETKNENEK